MDIAEELVRRRKPKLRDFDWQSLVHELSVYQEELLVQNDALMRAQAALEETRDRFVELYDFAPTGYVTLDRNGVILQCNFTCALWLGLPKHAIETFPLLQFVAPADRASYIAFLRRCRSATTGRDVEEEFRIRTADGTRICRVLARPHRHRDKRAEFFTSLADVTDLRAHEQERERFARDHAALSTRLIAAQDDERLRIARHLHDDVGQQYTAIRLTLERLAHAEAGDGQRRLICELQEMLARLDQRVHFMAAELRPAALDLGLPSALEHFVRDWSKTFDTPARFVSHLPDDVRQSPDIETHLYRIAQEALNNVAKHAKAKRVSVLLTLRHTDTVMVIEDDGKGFDVQQGKAGTRLGLLGMRERAEIIGGRLDIESLAGHGTSVFVTVPRPPPPRLVGRTYNT